MFRIVRNWWHSGRGKVTLRLFLFELLVVTLGVMLAQGISNWVGARQQQDQVVKEANRLRFEAARARHVSKVWRAAIPCLRDRVNLLVRAARPDSSIRLEKRDLQMPNGGTYSVEPIFDDVERAFRDRYGDELTDTYAILVATTLNTKDAATEMISQWATFGYLDPELGAPDNFDRAAMRAAGVRLRWLLDRMEARQERIDQIGRQLGVTPVGSGKALLIPDNPVTNCAEIWRNGHIWHVAR